MIAKRSIDARAMAAVAAGYLAGLAAYPNLPGPFLRQQPSARVLVAFTLPTTALVIYALFRSLWRHDPVRSGNGAFESTYQAIVLRVLLFVVALQAIVMLELTQVAAAFGEFEILFEGAVVFAAGTITTGGTIAFLHVITRRQFLERRLGVVSFFVTVFRIERKAIGRVADEQHLVAALLFAEAIDEAGG